LSPGGFFARLIGMRNLFLCLGLVLSLSASGSEIKFDFTDCVAGATPTNFASTVAGTGQPGDWKIVLDDVPPLLAPLTAQAPDVARRAVLAQTSRNPTDERFPLFIYDREKFTDFTFSTRFKIVAGVVEQMAGIVFRFQNTSNFYVLRASALGHNVRFYEVVNGIRSEPLGASIDITNGMWHTLAVQCQGNQITCWFDNRLLLPPLHNNSFNEGKVGFWTKSDAVSLFCDAEIDYTPRIPAAQALVDSIMEKQPRILGLRIYALDARGDPHVIASKDPVENGQPGNDTDKKTINEGAVFYGRHDGVDLITLPLRDHNGDPVAAVRLWLKSFLGETQNNAMTRARMVLKNMEAEVTSSEELLR
jgi:hypothetical protein